MLPDIRTPRNEMPMMPLNRKGMTGMTDTGMSGVGALRTGLSL